jgi:hypothetical protein
LVLRANGFLIFHRTLLHILCAGRKEVPKSHPLGGSAALIHRAVDYAATLLIQIGFFDSQGASLYVQTSILERRGIYAGSRKSDDSFIGHLIRPVPN